MTDETTSEQLAEIDRDMADIERQVAELVEEAQRADYPQAEPETTTDQLAEIEGQAEPVQVREGRWRTRRGDIKNIRPCEPLQGAHFVWPWTDGIMTFQDNGRHQGSQESAHDLVEYLGPIEEQPEPVPQPNAATIDELRSEVSYVQRLLGESRQRSNELETLVADLQTANAAAEAAKAAAGAALLERQRRNEALVTQGSRQRKRLTQLEELVASLRTINEAQEKAVEAAGKENTALRNQLTAVKAELASVAADRQRLRIELDAAQQVPADSPELRQLRADLAEVIRERDQYRHCYDEVSSHLETIEKTAKAETIEAIVEWLVPIRTCGSQALATAVISNLPHIMRSLTGLEDEGIE